MNLASLSKANEAVLTKLFSFIEQDQDMRDIRYVAYVLATIKWETGDTWQPTTESGSDNELEARYGTRLGNAQFGDAARYRGRGYLQIVGKANYQKMNEVLGLVGTDSDLVKYPDKLLDPLVAYRVLSHGMRNGSLTGKKLSDFITKDKADYRNARKVVNGLDHAEGIMTDANKFEAILRDSLAKN